MEQALGALHCCTGTPGGALKVGKTLHGTPLHYAQQPAAAQQQHSAATFQRTTMRLGTAFTTVAVAVAPRGVSADGNSVSSKLQVHVSRPAHVLILQRSTAESHGSEPRALLHCMRKWTAGFLASPLLPLPTQGGSSRLIIWICVKNLPDST